MRHLTSLILPALVAAQTFVLVINTKEGQTIEVETQNIDKMEVVERAPVVNALPAPNVSFTTNSSGGLLAVWGEVEGASWYAYSIDGAEYISTYNTFVNLQAQKAGKHTLAVMACADAEGLTDSAPTTVEFVISLNIAIAQGTIGMDSAQFTFTPGVSTTPYFAAVLPSTVSTDADRISQVRALAASDASLRHTGTATVTFSGLKAGESYQVVAFGDQEDTKVHTLRFSTVSEAYKPGDTGFVFPPAVSLEGGYVDVDKVGDLSRYGYSGTDDELCWACSTTGMIQWWLNDYKTATGKDYPLRIALPSSSKCYSTAVMDVVAQAFYHDAGRPDYVFEWFFKGMPNSIGSYTLNGHAAFNTDYANVGGNFAGMTADEYKKYVPYAKEQNSYFLYSSLTEENVKIKASSDIIGWLKDGPLYIAIQGGNHALTCWGVKYTVDVKGNPIITKIYYAENDMISGNVKNGLNSSSITWKQGDGPHMTSTGGSNVEITGFLPMRGYSRVK